ncbi:hypothetical protein H4R19_003218 [Coemansia spiralis]|nr:hypothetical protein H4R19_003218 [Coemansia spiralis]
MRSEAASLPAALRRRRGAPGARLEAAQALLYPDRTIYNVEAADCYFRRFTPDGKYLIGFSRTLAALHVFRVVCPSPSTQALAAAAAAEPDKSEFWRFFRLVWTRTYTGMGESLHRDLCLVSPSANHLIVARLRRSTPPANAEVALRAHRPNTLSCIRPAEDVAILVIDIHTGELADTREYLGDNIHLGGHSGISIYEDRLCVLSLRHQCMRLLRIGPDGRLTDLHEIGWYTREDDAIYEEQLRVNEARVLAALHCPDSPGAGGSRRCADEAPARHTRKRRRLNSQGDAHSVGARLAPPPEQPLQGAADSPRRALRMADLAPGGWQEPPSQSTGGMPLTDAAVGATQPQAGAQPGGSAVDRHPPFLFATSLHARQMLERSDEARATAAAAATDWAATPAGGSSIVGSPAVTPDTVDRAMLVSYRLLQGLPARYRMMFRRIMHPSTRLDNLTDSDIMSIEPSLATAPYSGLKQRLLGALHMRARAADDGGQQLHYFFRAFRQYEGLILWRAQFVTRTRLLLRFVTLQVAMSRAVRPQAISSTTLANAFTLLAEYDIAAARFGRIWDSGDDDLYAEIEHRMDCYRVPMAGRSSAGGSASAHAPSMANDLYLRDAFESAQAAIRSARTGGPAQATRKATAALPLAPQCVQESPLLSPARLQCNLRARQALERLRPVGLAPIRFFDRASGAVKFVLSPNPTTIQAMAASDGLPVDAAEPLAAHVLQSGAVLALTGGSGGSGEDPGLLGEGGSASAAQATPTISTPILVPGTAHKAGVAYLFHPTLPLVLSTRSDRGTMVPLPTCNIHFRHGT